MDEEVAMRIETQRPEMPVHVNPSGESVVAQIKEQQRREAAERAHLAQVISNTEVHRR